MIASSRCGGVRVRSAWLAVASILCSAACVPKASEITAPTGPGRHILFVGNSLTYVNDLPGVVASIAKAAGDTVSVAQVVGPDLALIDHLKGATNATGVIGLGGWTYVVLQEGPS